MNIVTARVALRVKWGGPQYSAGQVTSRLAYREFVAVAKVGVEIASTETKDHLAILVRTVVQPMYFTNCTSHPPPPMISVPVFSIKTTLGTALHTQEQTIRLYHRASYRGDSNRQRKPSTLP